jgi:threonine/homoserine/homoserine lactone efflux protein
MNFELYLAFVLATTILIVIPGPAVALIVATSLSHGTRAALVTVAGSSSAIAVLLGVTALGMTSLMLLLSQWFEVLRWAGVAYLLYLGIQQWRSKPQAPGNPPAKAVSAHRFYLRGFVVNATNPKTLVFYAAFFPQFVDPAGPLDVQLVVLCLTFLGIATLLDSGYALLAGRLRPLLASGRAALLRARITGSLLIAAGLGLALARRGG